MWAKKKWVFQILLLLLILSLTFWGLFQDSDLSALRDYIQSAEMHWWVLGIFLVLCFISTESLILHIIMKTLGTAHKPSHCLLYSFVGFFFSCITPSAGGGQPMQIYYMKKDGIDSADSAPMLILVTIAYKLVLLFWGLVIIITRPPQILAALEPVKALCFLGFFLTAGFIICCLLAMFRPELLQKCLQWFLAHLRRKWPASPKLQLFEKKTLEWLDRYHTAAGRFQNHRRLLLLVMLLSILQRSFLFLVPFVTLQSMGFVHFSFAKIILLQAMISLATDLLPLPGGTGANEAMFLAIYEPLLGESLCLPVLVISRSLSYYSQLLICAVMTIIATFIISNKKSKEKRL